MKYVITESQYKFLTESNYLGLKRRLTYDKMESFIHNAELDFPQLCDDFGDEFEYGDNVISRAVDNFLTVDETFMNSLGDEYDEVYDFVHDWTKEHFGEYLLDVYRMTCEGEEFDEDF